jgi:hypothetical protein
MRIDYEFTDLVLTSHAGLAALAQLLKAARHAPPVPHDAAPVQRAVV